MHGRRSGAAWRTSPHHLGSRFTSHQKASLIGRAKTREHDRYPLSFSNLYLCTYLGGIFWVVLRRTAYTEPLAFLCHLSGLAGSWAFFSLSLSLHFPLAVYLRQRHGFSTFSTPSICDIRVAGVGRNDGSAILSG